MSNFKKILVSILSCLMLVTSISMPLHAQENTLQSSKSPDQIEARWWPGNPNPEPGSEAWLQLYGYKTPGNPTIARKCALEALGGSFGASSIASWIAGGTFTVLNFARTFGASWAVGYLACIIRYM